MPLAVERPSPTTLVVSRRFAAPPARVYAAHTEPALLRGWIGGYGGWALTACEHDVRPAGALRYRFEAPDGSSGFDIAGTYLSLEPPQDGQAGRTIHVERMHMPDPTPETRVETVFAPDGDGTVLTMTMQVDDPAAMDAMLASGMTDGMAWTYDRLDALTAGPA